MTDLPATPPAENAGAPTGVDADPKPVVTAVSLIGVLLTGLCLVAADRLDRSGTARTLAVGTVVTALLAVLVALGGQLSTLIRPGRGARVALVAGLLCMVSVLLAGAAAVVAVQPADKAVPSAEPTVVVQRNAAAAGLTMVTAQLSFPGLPAGSVVNATMTGVPPEGEQARYMLARSAVRVGADGPAVVQLTGSANPSDEVVIEAKAPGHACSMRLPAAGMDEGAPAEPVCTKN